MKLNDGVLLGGALSLLTLCSFGQTLPNGETIAHPGVAVELGKGVVIEAVKKNLEAEKAGLQEGDILLHWTRGDAQGQIDSPFDLSQIEIEQAPRGAVTLEGLRAMQRQTWTLGPGSWGADARPNLPDGLLSGYLEGQKLASAGKVQDAAERWRSTADNVRESRPSWLGSWFLFHAGEVSANARQWKEADAAYAESIDRSAGAEPAIRVQLLRTWAAAFRQRADWANTEKYYQKAADESQKSGSESLIFADTLDGLGAAAWQSGDTAKVEKSYSQALNIQQKLTPASLATARSLNGLGVMARNRDDPAKAEDYLNQALAIRERLAPATWDVADTLNNLAVVAGDRGDLEKAFDYYQQALNILKELHPDSLDVAANLHSLGNIAKLLGDLDKAEGYYLEALAIREKQAADPQRIANTLNNLGNVARDRGDLNKAEEYHHKALELREKAAPGEVGVAASFHNLGNVALDRGDLVKAEEYFRQAAEIEEKRAPGSINLALTLNNLGYVAQDHGNLTKAEQYFRRSLAIKNKLSPESPGVVESLNCLGDVFRERGDLTKAEEYHQQALTLQEKLAPDSLDAAQVLSSLASLFQERGDLDKAEQYYLRELSIREKLAPESKLYAEALAGLATIKEHRQQWDVAAPLLEKALNVLESQLSHLGGGETTRSGFRAQHANYYQDYIDLLMRREQPEQALQVLERSRAQTMLEMLAAGHVDLHRGADAALIEREHSLKADINAKVDRRMRLESGKHTEEQIATMNHEIDLLLAQYNELEGEIRSSSPSYAALTQPQSLSAKQIERQLLDSATVLLEYSLGQRSSYVFAVTSASLDAYQLPKQAEIENAARRVYELLTARNRDIKGETPAQRKARLATAEVQFPQATAALGEMVLAPVKDQLKGKRLLIVSDGALQYVPFAVLPEPEALKSGNAGNPKRLPLLVEAHEIVNLPSASVLAVLRRESIRRQEASKAVAVLADPVFAHDDARVHGGRTPQREHETVDAKSSTWSAGRLTRSMADVGLSTDELYLPRLRFTRHEAAAIMAVAPAGQAMEALDFRASRAIATSPELSNYRIVHFATHGLLDSEHPQLSGLVLSMVDEQGKPQNGFLDLEDIYNLNLPADLVVLSACETGLGKEIQGEGLVGLTRGFMYAGASRVVASLWKVDDVATTELMRRFYQAMEKEGMRPAAALRQAQIGMWKQKDWKSPYYWAAFQMQGEWK